MTIMPQVARAEREANHLIHTKPIFQEFTISPDVARTVPKIQPLAVRQDDVFVDTHGRSRRRKPGTAHQDEFREPSKSQKVAQLVRDMEVIFSPDAHLDLKDVQDAYGLSATDVEKTAGAYVDSICILGTQQEAQVALDNLYEQFQRVVVSRDPEAIQAVSRNPLYLAVLNKRADQTNAKTDRAENGEVASFRKRKSRLAALRNDLGELVKPDSGATSATIREQYGVTDPTIRKYFENVLAEQVATLREEGVFDPSTGERVDPGVEGALRILEEPFLQVNGQQHKQRGHPMHRAIMKALNPSDRTNSTDSFRTENIVLISELWKDHSISQISKKTGLHPRTVVHIASHLRAAGIDLPSKSGFTERAEQLYRHRLAEVRRLYGTMSNGEIAARLGIRIGTVSKLAGDLRRQGFELQRTANDPATAAEPSPESFDVTPQTRDRIEREKPLFKLHLRSHQVAALLGVSESAVRGDLTRMPREVKRELGIGPGRRKEVEIDWSQVAETLATMGIDPQEASARSGIPLPEVAIAVSEHAGDEPHAVFDASTNGNKQTSLGDVLEADDLLETDDVPLAQRNAARRASAAELPDHTKRQGK